MKKSRTPQTFAEYKKAERTRKFTVIATRILLLVAFVGLWQLAATLGWIDEFLVSKPSAVYSLFIEYCKSGQLWHHVWISVYETLLGLLIGTLAGLVIAVALYLMPRVYQVLDPFLVVLNALPKTALAPILIIWIGTGVKGIVGVSVSLSVVVTILQAYSYFIGVDQEKVKMLRTFKANSLQVLTRLVLPSNLGNMISIVKINIGLAWVGVIVGEFLVSRGGIGYLVVYGGQVFKLDLVMMGVIILAVIAFLMYEVVNILEKYIKTRDSRRRHKQRKFNEKK